MKHGPAQSVFFKAPPPGLHHFVQTTTSASPCPTSPEAGLPPRRGSSELPPPPPDHDEGRTPDLDDWILIPSGFSYGGYFKVQGRAWRSLADSGFAVPFWPISHSGGTWTRRDGTLLWKGTAVAFSESSNFPLALPAMTG